MKIKGQKYNHETLHKLGAVSILSRPLNDTKTEWETIIEPDIDISDYEGMRLILEKEIKIKELKSFATQIIYENAPSFKQANVGMGIYDATKSAPIKNWVKAGIQAVQEIKDKINNATSTAEIEANVFDYDSLKARIEVIFITL